MCLYQPNGADLTCQHAQCQILYTIRRLNAPVFSPKKPSRERFKNIKTISEVSIQKKMQVEGQRQAFSRKMITEKTILSSHENVELQQRVMCLQKEVTELKQLAFWMRDRLLQQRLL